MSDETSPSPSYEAIPGFGTLYDSVPLYASRTDIQFYVEEAKRTAGQILELGCGTGRILIPIARAGKEVTGLDGSREMLERCASMLGAEPNDVRQRVTLHFGDARDFTLGETFALVTAPFRIVQHLPTIDEQLGFLTSAARHLEPGGRLVFDVYNPNFSTMLNNDGSEREDTPEHALPDGRAFRRAFRVARVRWVDQVNEIELLYYVSPSPGVAAVRHVQAFEMRWYLRAELEHLLARSGFRVDAIYGNFDRSPLTDNSPEQVVCATRL